MTKLGVERGFPSAGGRAGLQFPSLESTTIRLLAALLPAALACCQAPPDQGAERSSPSRAEVVAAARSNAIRRFSRISFPEAFRTYECRPDCADQQRGFDWARGRMLDDPERCPEGRAGFSIGCVAYATVLRDEVDAAGAGYDLRFGRKAAGGGGE